MERRDSRIGLAKHEDEKIINHYFNTSSFQNGTRGSSWKIHLQWHIQIVDWLS